MIQSLIATIVDLVSLMFALAAGAFLEERKRDPKVDAGSYKAPVCIVLSLMLAACALGVAAR